MAKPVPPAYLRTKLIPHAQQVCQLYKAALYNIKAQKLDSLEFRYEAVLLRARFDENRNIKDVVQAKKLLEEGWAELKKKKFAFPYLYPTSPGGVAYERYDYKLPDYLVDNWHPLEKLQYPDYFARREKRKAEFIERWKLRYGEPEPQAH
uniref:NADH dehydrogenase [ubiquinone] 1 beta subcomplex subunit 9 n=1 Tax=Schistocephalus solidus TaxID=70667 RepID=A0A0X3NZM7_SCHSO